MYLNLDPFPELLTGQIHIYITNIQDWLPQYKALLRTLSFHERQRLERYKIPTKADQFLCSRGLLRLILAEYLQEDPALIHLGTNSAGKPFLTDHQLGFNLSHSEEYLLLGVSHFNRIGVDIQKVYPISSQEKVVSSYFSSLEKTYLASLDKDTSLERFFAIWSAKEAYLKALGKGFSKSPTTFNLLPNSAPEKTFLLSDSNNPQGNPAWTIERLNLPDGFQGAVAVEGKLEEILQIPLAPNYPN